MNRRTFPRATGPRCPPWYNGRYVLCWQRRGEADRETAACVSFGAPPRLVYDSGSERAGESASPSRGVELCGAQVTDHWRLPDPGLFFRHLPDWTPPLRPLLTSLPPEAIDRAAAAFADVVREQSTSEGMPQAAVIGIGARR